MKRDDDDDVDEKEGQNPEMAGWMYTLPFMLKKYGSHLLLGASLVLLGFVLWQRYQANQAAKLDESWVKLYDATGKIQMAAMGATEENPANALRDAANASDVPAVRAAAYLYLGDYYLRAINLGHYGQVEKVDIDEALRQAEAAYQRVVTESKAVTPIVLSARMGLAKVAEDKHEWSAAKELYTALIADAKKIGYVQLAAIAQQNMDSLDDLKLPVALAVAAPAATQPMSGFGGSDLMNMNIPR